MRPRSPLRACPVPESDRPPAHAAEAALTAALARVLRLHAIRATDPALAADLDRLSAWQAQRLSDTYADLAADKRYTGAIETHPSPLGVVWGVLDPIAVYDMTARMLAARPDTTLITLDTVGPYTMVEDPD